MCMGIIRISGVLIFLFTCSVKAQNLDSLHFVWSGDSIGGQYFEKTAILLPVHITNDTNTYYFQFDTGANHSTLYLGTENKIKPVVKETNIQTNIGVLHFDTLSSMSPFIENQHLVLGTLGADILQSKMLLIDFQKQLIVYGDSIETTQFHNYSMQTSFGRPAIDISINGNPYTFLFDTGSSIFEIWTTRRLWKKYRSSNSKIDELKIWSWGELNSVYTSQINHPTNIYNHSNLQIVNISYNSNRKFQSLFKSAKVGGIIGLKPFYNTTIIIDVPAKQFGIKG